MSLAGIRVLDLSRVLAGPWCGQTLADLGADVVKVERCQTGDDTRSWGPPFLRTPSGSDNQEAAYYLGTNRNKRSITCDLSHPQGQQLVKDLATEAHILIENYKVGDMARYGLDYASLSAIAPRLVYCSITGYGHTGPYKERAGYDYAIQGLGGLMSVTGERDDLGGGPQKVGVAVADLFTGLYATVGILAALRHAEATGQGQHLDMALLDAQVAMLANLGANYLVEGQFSGKVPGRMGNAHANIVPYQVFETAPQAGTERDHLIVAVGNDGQFAKLCEIMGHPEWASDARFSRNADRVRHRAVLVPMLAQLFLQRTKAQWLADFERAQIPGAPINQINEVFADPHVRERGMIQTLSHPLGTTLELVASPIKMSVTPTQTRRPPPMLGEHTDEVLQQWLGCSSERIAELRQLKVID